MGVIWNGLVLFMGLIIIVVILLVFPASVWDVGDLTTSYLLVLPILAVIAYGFWWLKK